MGTNQKQRSKKNLTCEKSNLRQSPDITIEIFSIHSLTAALLFFCLDIFIFSKICRQLNKDKVGKIAFKSEQIFNGAYRSSHFKKEKKTKRKKAT